MAERYGKKRKFLISHVYIVLGFSSVRFAELEMEDGGPAVKERIFLYGSTLSSVVSLKEFMPLMFLRDAREVRIKLLCKAM